MLHVAKLIQASSLFWQDAARQFVCGADFAETRRKNSADYSGMRVIVPTFEHAQLFLQALAREIPGDFIPPRINTMFAWLAMLPPLPDVAHSPAASERLMGLYAQFREHAWLKSLFGAKRNTDLLPLAQTLLLLSDELTLALIPTVHLGKEALADKWHTALAQLPLPVQKMASDETQLVWTIWQSQIDAQDAIVQRYQNMMRIAQQASEPLIWISPTAPDAMEQGFLDAYQENQPVLPIVLDWRADAVPAIFSLAWPNLLEADGTESSVLEPD